MQVLTTQWDVHAAVRDWRRQADRIGFVPTMGNLHAGHMRLVQVAKQHCDKVVVSIYVNPMQFGAGEDFTRYPRTLEEDQAKLAPLNVDVVFVPNDQSMYPHGHQQTTYVDVPGLSIGLEGAQRPGHFRGVATVVNKLFNIVQPDVAVFGEKDFQQLLVIRRMVRDLDMPIEIIGEPTVRETDGLAMSSRNQYLSRQERQQAGGLYETLQYVRDRLQRNGVDFTDLEQDAVMRLEKQGFVPDYVAIRQSDTLEEPKSRTDPLVILAAVRLGKTRLLDNLRV
ncbi:MAG: pantoate--beta-alanine ligase [Gammaproteobacteria bacterium]|nr:pantoate--beta-alanine ligase [Gammaproteobacteria bacterium]